MADDRPNFEINPLFSRPGEDKEHPKFVLADAEMLPETAYQIVHDDSMLDGNARLNLATFVGTWMDGFASRLYSEAFDKNMIDKDEYRETAAIEDRCWKILARLWNAPDPAAAIGTSTIGSSEACMLGGLAFKRRWQAARRAAGKPADKPNLVMSSAVQVCWEKFTNYWDVEPRFVPISEDHKTLDGHDLASYIDENTIGIFVILGSTYTGHYEPVEAISHILDAFEAKTGNDIPIHVDAASGGFVAPFTRAKAGGHKWDFSLPRVKSINTSGHKFGLVYAGVGWIIWRDESYLPKHLVFELHYLGGTEESYTLNFSRPGAQIIAQYYNLIHLGFEGYRTIMENCMSNARLLSQSLEATGWYTCVSDIHRPKGVHSLIDAVSSVLPSKDGEADTSAAYNAGLPVVAFRFSDAFKKSYPHLKQETISHLLRAKQYIIPNYPLPPDEEKTEILRIVVRESMSFDLLDRLISDICATTQEYVESNEQELKELGVLGGASGSGSAMDNSAEKSFTSLGVRKGKHGKGKGRTPMSEGVHRSVC